MSENLVMSIDELSDNKEILKMEKRVMVLRKSLSASTLETLSLDK
jgi:hypothetical protein